MRVKLGDRVRDQVSGFSGIATSRTEYLNGCVHIGVSPTETKDGKRIDTEWIDERQLEPDGEPLVLAEVYTTAPRTGGPGNHPPARLR